MTAKPTTFTPRGLTQNWSNFQEQGNTKKVKSGGPFQSKNDIIRRRHVRNSLATTVKITEREVDTSKFSVKVTEAGSTVTRINGKFVSPQVYSKSLAEKLGI